MATKRLWNKGGEMVDVNEDHPLFENYRKKFPLDADPKAKPDGDDKKTKPDGDDKKGK